MRLCQHCKFNRTNGEFPKTEISPKCLNHYQICLPCLIDPKNENKGYLPPPEKIECVFPDCGEVSDSETAYILYDEWKIFCLDSSFIYCQQINEPIIPEKENESFLIKISNISGVEAEVSVSLEMTIDSLMCLIRDQTHFGVPIENQTLSYNNQNISNILFRKKTLKELNIKLNDKIFIQTKLSDNLPLDETLIVTLNWLFFGGLVNPELFAFACSTKIDERTNKRGGKCEGFVAFSSSRFNINSLIFDTKYYLENRKNIIEHGQQAAKKFIDLGEEIDPRVKEICRGTGPNGELRSHSQRLKIQLKSLPTNINKIIIGLYLGNNVKKSQIKCVRVMVETETTPLVQHEESEVEGIFICCCFSRNSDGISWSMESIGTSLKHQINITISDKDDLNEKTRICNEFTLLADKFNLEW